MDAALRDHAAAWLAGALREGTAPLPFPPAALPRSMLDGQRIAARALDMLDLASCGLRLTHLGAGRPVAGPVLPARLRAEGETIALSRLPHARATPAIAGRLAVDLPRRGDEMPNFASLHPAIDVESWRLPGAPGTGALAAADLAGLGEIVLGRGRRLPPMRLRVSLAAAGTWRRGEEIDIEEAMLAAALAARRAGGLPVGSLIVVPVGVPVTPAPGMELLGSFGRLGRLGVRFA